MKLYGKFLNIYYYNINAAMQYNHLKIGFFYIGPIDIGPFENWTFWYWTFWKLDLLILDLLKVGPFVATSWNFVCIFKKTAFDLNIKFLNLIKSKQISVHCSEAGRWRNKYCASFSFLFTSLHSEDLQKSEINAAESKDFKTF